LGPSAPPICLISADGSGVPLTEEVAVALQGTLDTFALADVLRLLAATTKTGRLHIEGDRGTGNVWLTEGAVVAGAVELHGPDGIVPCTEPSDVVFELLRHAEGTFEFVPDESSEDSRPPMAVEEVVGSAEHKLSDWREVEAVVPSLEHTVTLAPEIDEEIVLGREGWRTLLAVGEGRTVGEVGERLGMGEIAVSNAVKTLVDERLAVIGERVEPVVEPDIEEIAATTTLEDVVADLGASPELDVVVRAELAPGEVVVDPASLGGSHAVDLDTALDSDETGHAYLEEASDAPVDMPEPLPEDVAPEPALDAQDLAQMSPRAAEAIAAASGQPQVEHDEQAEQAEQGEQVDGAGEPQAEQSEEPAEGEDGNGEQPMNRNLLMKFISSK
jgi:hypothetical protein